MHHLIAQSLILLFTLPLLSANPDTSPFFPPSLQRSNSNHLQARQSPCASDGVSCANLGASDLCCKKSTSCAVDQAGHIACCPLNAACTGTLDSGAIITSIPTSALGGAPTAPATITGASVVPNAFFPFVYLPTTYPNAAVCTQSYSSCQTEFSSCTAALGGGGGNAVTVNGGGVPGITVQAPVGSISAASICSSLSLEACHNLQLPNCNLYPSGTADATVQGTFVAPTGGVGRRRKRRRWAVGAGVGAFVAGMIL